MISMVKTVIMIAQVLMTMKMMVVVVMVVVVNKENADVMESTQLCILLSKDCAAMFVQWGKMESDLCACKECLQNVFAPVLHKSLARMKPESHRTVFSPGPKLRSGRTRAEKNRENAVYGHLHWPLLFVMTIQVLVMKIHYSESKKMW